MFCATDDRSKRSRYGLALPVTGFYQYSFHQHFDDEAVIQRRTYIQDKLMINFFAIKTLLSKLFLTLEWFLFFIIQSHVIYFLPAK